MIISAGTLKSAAAAMALATAAGAGWWLGSARVQAQWQAAELAASRQAAESRAEQTRQTATAAAGHETERRQIEARLTGARRDLAAALRHAPRCPLPSGASQNHGGGADNGAVASAGAEAGDLGSLRVPAAVVDSLRRAGKDPAHP